MSDFMPENCRHCGKPKEEHHKKELWCFDSIEWFYENKPDTKFEPKSSSQVHTVKESTFEYTYDDCIFYKIICSCGKECTGWTKQDAIDEHQKHLKKPKSAPQKIKR